MSAWSASFERPALQMSWLCLTGKKVSSFWPDWLLAMTKPMSTLMNVPFLQTWVLAFLNEFHDPVLRHLENLVRSCIGC